MWNVTTPGSSEPGHYVDTERKALVSQRTASHLQMRQYFDMGPRRRRMDLSEREFQLWTRRFDEAESLKIEMGRFVAAEIDRADVLFGANAYRWCKPLMDQAGQLSPLFTGLAHISMKLSWQDLSRTVNWYDRILDRVDKYGLRYSELNTTVLDAREPEVLSKTQKQQAEIRDLMLREMGVDRSALA